MERTGKIAATFGALCLVTVSSYVAAGEPATNPTSRATTSPATQPKVPFTIGKETTVLTGPLRVNGTVDYIAAINGEASKGVTKENNAAVVLLPLVCPSAFPHPDTERVYKLLGLDTKPAAAQADLGPISQANADIRNECWQAKNHPKMVEWLKDNGKFLDAVVAASRRERWFVPMVTVHADMTESVGPETYSLRNVGTLASGLVVRANLAIGEGRETDAWADILAILRLSILIEQDVTMCGRAEANWLMKLGQDCAGRLLARDALDGKAAKSILSDLQSLPAPKSLLSAIPNRRCEILDVLGRIAADPVGLPRVLQEMGVDMRGNDEVSLRAYTGPAVTTARQWDELLGKVNEVFDRDFAGLGKMAYAEQIRTIKDKEKSLEACGTVLNNMLESAGPNAPITKWQAAVQSKWSINYTFFYIVRPLVHILAIHGDVEAARVRHDALIIGAALAVHRAAKGSYPDKLADLSPTYLKAIPTDYFVGGNDFIYKKTGAGYILYSVGENGKEDGGKDKLRGGDDIVVKAEK